MSFDRSLARLLLEVCRYTYADHVANPGSAWDRADALREIQSRAPDSAPPVPITDGVGPATSTALVLPRPDVNVVCFMGTETELADLRRRAASVADWFQNVRFAPVPFELPGARLDCRVHDGFLSELRQVWPALIDRLGQLGGPMRPLQVTGHSQGGAEAALAAAAFLRAGYKVEAVYTFAAPRPGDARLRDFVMRAGGVVRRIEFGNDIVPHLPPSAVHLARAALGALRSLGASVAERLGNHDFVGVGTLCYGDGRSPFRIDLSASDEEELFMQRLHALTSAGPDLVEHHHLRGTTSETLRGLVGNYTRLLEV